MRHTLQPTALVHEAYLKLIDQTRVNWQGVRISSPSAHKPCGGSWSITPGRRNRAKRGGGWQRITLDERLQLLPDRDADLLAVDEAIEKLAQLDPRQARIVELRFFAGLTVEEVAEASGPVKADRRERMDDHPRLAPP